MAGLPTRARAMATRWRCPPESWVGRAWGRPSKADQGQGVEGSGAPFGLGDPGVEEPVGHVVEDALVLGQEELLEHEADPGGPQRGQLRSESWATSKPVIRTWPELGRSRLPIRCNKGGLARPRRPHDADQLALGDGEGDPPQGGHGRLARVDLGHLVDFEHWPAAAVGGEQAAVVEAARGHCGGDVDGHRFGTTTRWPAARPDPVTWTRPSASSKRPRVTGTRRWMPSASTTSTA